MDVRENNGCPRFGSNLWKNGSLPFFRNQAQDAIALYHEMLVCRKKPLRTIDALAIARFVDEPIAAEGRKNLGGWRRLALMIRS